MQKNLVLGADLGNSSIDLVLMNERKIVSSKSFPVQENSFTEKNLLKMFKKFPLNKVKTINATGSNSRFLKEKFLGLKVIKVNEIQAIAFGAKFVSNSKNFLTVSMGSGTALVSVKGKKFSHIGGTAVGGKTLENLAKLLIQTPNVKELENLALKGDLKRVDLTLQEIYPKGIGLLPKEATASHFGKLRNPRKQDKALALINLIAQVIGSIAVFAALAYKHKEIVFTGKLISLNLLKKVLFKRIFWLNKSRFKVPKNAGIATAIGACIS